MVNLVKLCGMWVCLFSHFALVSYNLIPAIFMVFSMDWVCEKFATMEVKSVGTFPLILLKLALATPPPLPPLPPQTKLNLEQNGWNQEVKLSAFFCQNIARGSGGGGGKDDGMNPKPNKTIVLGSRILRNYCLEGLLHTVPSSLVLHWRFSATIVFHFYCDSAKGAKKWTTLLKKLTVFWPFGRSWTLETFPFSGIWPQRSRHCSHTPEGIHLSLVWETLKQPK